MRKLYALLLPAFLFLLPALSHAQVATIKWDFGAASPWTAAPIAGTVPAGLSTPVVISGNSFGTSTLLSASSVSSGYTGATGTGNAGVAANKISAFDATNSAFFEWTLTPGSGQAITVTGINFGTRSTASGPGNYDIRTSLDNYAAPVNSGALVTSAGSTTWSLATNSGITSIVGATGEAITIRIYSYGPNGASNPASGTVNWRIDDLAVTVDVSGTSTPQPAVSISGSPTAFSTIAGTPSPSQSVTVSGSNLTNDITVTAPAGYEVSLDNSNFAASQPLTASGGTVAATPVYARISAATPLGPVSGNLAASSTGATDATVALSGTVNTAVTPPTGLTATAASAHAVDITATANATGDNILIAYNTTATFGTPSGALSAGATISGGGTVLYNGPAAGLPFQQTGLTASTKYFYSAWSVDGSNSYSSSAVAANATTNNPAAANIVINQIYGGGGNSGAQYNNDFVELYNDADTAVDLAGWSIQYASAAGTSWAVSALSGIIPAHSFFLVQEGSGANTPQALPTPDAIPANALAMSATSGKVILANSTIAQTSNANPTGGTVIDKVGYGTANGFETAAADVLTNTTSITRVVDGLDNNNNKTDFHLTVPLPRNSTYTTTAPVVTSLNPPAGRTDVPVSYVPFLVFSKPVVKATGTVTLTVNGTASTPIDINDNQFVLSNDTLTFTTPLAANTAYGIAISAGAVQDVYGNNFAGLSAATWSFTTYNSSAAITAFPYSNDLNTCSGSGLLPGGFTTYNATGDQIWDCTTFGRDPNAPQGASPFGAAVQINGYANNADHLNEDWLISPKFDLTGIAVDHYPLLSYWGRNAFAGAPLQLKISTNYTGTGDPRLATWTDLNGKFPSVGSDTWTSSANINLSNYRQSSVYIAFVYTSTTDDGSRWTLDDIRLDDSPTPPPPSLTLSTSNLVFGYAAPGNTADKKLNVIGNDLVSDLTIVSRNSNYTISADGTNFTDSLVIDKATANDQTESLFIRFAPGVTNSQFNDSLLVKISDTIAIVNVKGNSIDPASTLSVVDWNLNWFGTPDPTLGVADKTLQEQNVGIILPSLHADLYVLQEVVNEPALANIVSTMPGYAYMINNYGSYSNTAIGDPEPLNQVQKLAFVYNTAKITVIRTDSLLTTGVNTAADTATRYYNDWASGRFPYMLTANVTLANPGGGTLNKTIHFVNIHAKANTAPVLTAYTRRQNGATALDSLLRTVQYFDENVMVLGDFNDDLNQTITAGVNPPYSSYKVFTDNPGHYSFPTRILSQQGQHSDVNYSSVIDNVVIDSAMTQWYLPSSATVLSDVSSLVPKYGSTTTDHYPVFTQFSFNPPVALPVTLVSFTAVRQDAVSKLSWTTTKESNSASFIIERSGDNSGFSAIGTVAAQGNTSTTTKYTFTDAQPLTGKNYYRLKQVDLDGKSTYSKTVVLDFGGSLTLHISPNPAHGTANLFVGSSGEAFAIQIVNLSGQIVQQFQTTPGTANIPMDVSKLAKGVYTVKAISAKAVVTQKLLVQ